MVAKPKAFVFDAYGTLFDVRSVLARCEESFPGHGAALTTLWRTKQLEYSWQRALMDRYVDFWQVTQDGLRYACQTLGLSLTSEKTEHIMQSYLTLEPYPETKAALEQLQDRPLAILSNGSPSMLEALVKYNGLSDKFTHVISVDEAKTYKPHPAVYRLVPARLSLPTGEIGFVSANGWDAAGAKAFGFQVFWINRQKAPVEELGVKPDASVSSLLELTGF